MIERLFWFILGLFGLQRKEDAEKERAKITKENMELRAENAGIKKEQEIKDEQARDAQRWEEAEKEGDTKKKYDILRDDFDGDPD